MKESISSVMWLCCHGHVFRKHGTLLGLMRLMFDYVNLHSRRQSTDLFQLYVVLNEITAFNVVKKKLSFCFCFLGFESVRIVCI